MGAIFIHSDYKWKSSPREVWTRPLYTDRARGNPYIQRLRFKLIRIRAMFIHSTTNRNRPMEGEKIPTYRDFSGLKYLEPVLSLCIRLQLVINKTLRLQIFRIKRLSSIMVNHLFSMDYPVYS